jgi:hypothetical protein
MTQHPYDIVIHTLDAVLNMSVNVVRMLNNVIIILEYAIRMFDLYSHRNFLR